ncbi:hypothetical protein [Streptomyces sp. NBC_01455]|uniref:hypothetical protein n=1 Tax=Streptomyces sp. NBC_01455 TaxID=2903874 RepID=UPI002E34C4FD|nr:hypothetical protein [Streptomyces sp. NBC_01455]
MNQLANMPKVICFEIADGRHVEMEHVTADDFERLMDHVNEVARVYRLMLENPPLLQASSRPMSPGEVMRALASLGSHRLLKYADDRAGLDAVVMERHGRLSAAGPLSPGDLTAMVLAVQRRVGTGPGLETGVELAESILGQLFPQGVGETDARDGSALVSVSVEDRLVPGGAWGPPEGLVEVLRAAGSASTAVVVTQGGQAAGEFHAGQVTLYVNLGAAGEGEESRIVRVDPRASRPVEVLPAQGSVSDSQEQMSWTAASTRMAVIDAVGRPVDPQTLERGSRSLTDAGRNVPPPKIRGLRRRPRLADTYQASSVQDDQHIAYATAAATFERNLGKYLSLDSDVADFVSAVTQAAWDYVSDVGPEKLPLFGTNIRSIPGAVGDDVEVLRNAALGGNLREQMTMLWNGLRSGLFDDLQSVAPPSVISRERVWRLPVDQIGSMISGVDVESPYPPLSAAERLFLGLPEGSQERPEEWVSASSVLHLPMISDVQINAAQTGALIGTGTSGTAYLFMRTISALGVYSGQLFDIQAARLALIAALLPAGHHTYHEVMQGVAVWAGESRNEESLGYVDSRLRYRYLAPFTEQELREKVAENGLFPDEIARGLTQPDPTPTLVLPAEEYFAVDGDVEQSVNSEEQVPDWSKARSSAGEEDEDFTLELQELRNSLNFQVIDEAPGTQTSRAEKPVRPGHEPVEAGAEQLHAQELDEVSVPGVSEASKSSIPYDAAAPVSTEEAPPQTQPAPTDLEPTDRIPLVTPTAADTADAAARNGDAGQNRAALSAVFLDAPRNDRSVATGHRYGTKTEPTARPLTAEALRGLPSGTASGSVLSGGRVVPVAGWDVVRGGAVVRRAEGVWMDPVSRPVGVGGRHGPRFVVESGFDVRRFEVEGVRFTDLTVRYELVPGVGVSPGEVDGLWERALAGVERVFNAGEAVFEDGRVLHVTLQRVDAGGDPHARVTVVAAGGVMDQFRWPVDAPLLGPAHEVGHQVGLRDVYPEEGAEQRGEEGAAGHLMGFFDLPAAEGLVQGGVRPRDLAIIRVQADEAQDLEAFRRSRAAREAAGKSQEGGVAPSSSRAGVRGAPVTQMSDDYDHFDPANPRNVLTIEHLERGAGLLNQAGQPTKDTAKAKALLIAAAKKKRPAGTARKMDDVVAKTGRELLLGIQRHAGTGRSLDLFRAMSFEEARGVLEYWNGPDRIPAEQYVATGRGTAKEFKQHFRGMTLGAHLGGQQQAGVYHMMNGASYDVLLKFTLKPGAHTVMFDPRFMALGPGYHAELIRKAGRDYQAANQNEGTLPGYIGVKAEQHGAFSLSLAQGTIANGSRTVGPSQLLFQLMVETVTLVSNKSGILLPGQHTPTPPLLHAGPSRTTPRAPRTATTSPTIDTNITTTDTRISTTEATTGVDATVSPNLKPREADRASRRAAGEFVDSVVEDGEEDAALPTRTSRDILSHTAGVRQRAVPLDTALGRSGSPLGLSDDEFAARYWWVASVNPFRATGGEYQTNCVLSAIAVDMALEENLAAGRASAEPVVYQAPPSELSPYEHLLRYRDRAPVPMEDHHEVISIMREAGTSARGMVVTTSESRIDHVLNVVNDEGAIVFLDGTNGHQVSAQHLKNTYFLPVTDHFPASLIAPDLRPEHTGRMLGRSGWESEYTHVLSIPDTDISGLSGEVLAHGPDGAVLTVEEKTLYSGPSGLLYRTRGQAEEGEGSAQEVESAILEVIVGVHSIHDGEPGNDLGLAAENYARIEQSLERIDTPSGRQPELLLSSLFSSPDWKFTEMGEVTLIGPRPIGDSPGGHIHHSFGVPLAGIYPFLQHVARYTWRDQSRGYHTKEHLVDALQFANEIADDYFHKFPGGSERSVEELRGHAALLYDMTAALAHGALDSDQLNKVHAAILVRHDLTVLFSALPEDVKRYLGQNAGNFRQAFEKLFRARIPGYDTEYRKERGLPSEASVDLFNVKSVYDIPVGSYLASGLGMANIKQEVIWSITTLKSLDTNNGLLVPLVVLEVRSYDRRHSSAPEAIRQHMTLRDMAREAYATAANLSWLPSATRRSHSSEDPDPMTGPATVPDVAGEHLPVESEKGVPQEELNEPVLVPGRWNATNAMFVLDPDLLSPVSSALAEQVTAVRHILAERTTMQGVMPKVGYAATSPDKAMQFASRTMQIAGRLAKHLDSVHVVLSNGLTITVCKES